MKTRLDRNPWPAGLTLLVLAIVSVLLGTRSSSAASLAQVDLFDRVENRALQCHRHRGRIFVAGEPGHEYAIRIRNTSDERVLAVVSVDGINVVSGETASPAQSGYVIEPGDYVNIQGWRKNLGRTAAFYFTDLGDSYASRTGRSENLGVVGVALFREQRRPSIQLEREKVLEPFPRTGQSARSAEARSPSAAKRSAADAIEQDASTAPLGTGHGRNEYSPVRRVHFERRSQRPDQMLTIRYDRRDNLVAMGVLPGPRWHDPDPFPSTFGFVPDP